MMKIKKNDQVKVTTGKDRGKTGSVERVFPARNAVVVTGLNLYKRHLKGRSEEDKGSITEVARPLALSKIALICPKCKEVTRVGWRVTDKGKIRVCRKCDAQI